jgi:AraC-like DNA-binding protein
MSIVKSEKAPIFRYLIFLILFPLAAYGIFCFIMSGSHINLVDINKFSITALSDANHDGDSKSELNINEKGEVTHFYSLGHKLVYPYTWIELKKKNGEYISTKNAVLVFTAIADTAMRIPVRLHINVNSFTRKDFPESKIMLEKMVTLEKGINYISLSSSEMHIPSWWYTLNNIVESQLPSYDLANTVEIVFVSDQLLMAGGSRSITYRDISLQKDLSYYHKIFFSLFSIAIVALAFLKFLPKFKRNAIYIPIHPQEVSPGLEKDHFSMIKKAIAGSYSNHALRAKQVAKEAGITENKVGAILKEETGMTFPEYLNFVRIEEAKRLLAETNLPVSDICYMVGFDYPQSLNRVFKKYTRLSPTEFRAANLLKINK